MPRSWGKKGKSQKPPKVPTLVPAPVLTKCAYCPKAYHSQCLEAQTGCGNSSNSSGLTRSDSTSSMSSVGGLGMFICGQHKCSECARNTSAAGGLLFRCITCSIAYCEDCLPVDTVESIGSKHGILENDYQYYCRQAYYIRCPTCCTYDGIFPRGIYGEIRPPAAGATEAPMGSSDTASGDGPPAAPIGRVIWEEIRALKAAVPELSSKSDKSDSKRKSIGKTADELTGFEIPSSTISLMPTSCGLQDAWEFVSKGLPAACVAAAKNRGGQASAYGLTADVAWTIVQHWLTTGSLMSSQIAVKIESGMFFSVLLCSCVDCISY